MLGDNVTHANFSVNDLAAAKKFYCETLGFKAVQDNEYILMIEGGQGTRALIYAKEDHKPWDSTVFGVVVDDVRAAVSSLKDQGVHMEKVDGTDEDGIMSQPEMGDAAWCKDPAGNWICISTNM